MKIPETPPDAIAHFVRAMNDQDQMMRMLQRIAGRFGQGGLRGKYLHWDQMKRRTPPDDLSIREWWVGTKLIRSLLARFLPLADAGGSPFGYALTDAVLASLHEIDRRLTGFVEIPREAVTPEHRDRYLMSSLMEESITSSQLEGAATTANVARDMIRAGKHPKNDSERMIRNNFVAMERIRERTGSPLTVELIREIQSVVTEGTLSDATGAGRLRTSADGVRVTDSDEQLLFTPPPAEDLSERLSLLCRFANGEIPDTFVHPVIRAIVLHFWLAYEHPFVDGNGRTARALFYWSMLKQGYWLFDFVSISSQIRQSHAQYYRAFLYTETDGNDLTYFVEYHLRVIEKAIHALEAYIRKKTAQIRKIQTILRGNDILNHRQLAIVSHGLRHPGFRYTIRSHRTSHRVTHQTARTDLLRLEGLGLMTKVRRKNRFVFQFAPNLERRLASLPDTV